MTRPGMSRGVGAVIGAALLLAGCGETTGTTAGAPGGGAPGGAAVGAATSSTATAADPGKSLDNFDPCSVVSDTEYVAALTAEAGDPSALGMLTPTHAPVDGSATGLPGAKACRLSYTSTDADGRVSQGGDPVIVTFDKYSNLNDLRGNNPKVINDYQSSGADAFEGPGDAGDPHITKNGYLFRLSGNSDLKLLKAVALGIAKRL